MYTKEDIYALLEEKMLSYQDIAHVPICRVDEPLVPIKQSKLLVAKPIEKQMLAITGNDIYIRETVAKMLAKASHNLQTFSKGLQLEVVYGYRHPSIQRENHNSLKQKMMIEHPTMTESELIEMANRFIAAPENAGHTMGGAVDVRVLCNGVPIDMGTQNREFVADTYVHSPFISKQAWKNRQMLRLVMTGVGFAPFDGEWWHFSYGDKEWAAYYGKSAALYEPIDFSQAQNKMVA